MYRPSPRAGLIGALSRKRLLAVIASGHDFAFLCGVMVGAIEILEGWQDSAERWIA